jgi:hypothetical protein
VICFVHGCTHKSGIHGCQIVSFPTDSAKKREWIVGYSYVGKYCLRTTFVFNHASRALTINLEVMVYNSTVNSRLVRIALASGALGLPCGLALNWRRYAALTVSMMKGKIRCGGN